MNVFLISCPLVLSCILRFLAEDSMVHLLAENLLAIVLFQWMVGFKTTFVFALAAFLGLAFYQTRVEYTNITENVREIGHHTSRDRLVPSCPLSNPGISDSLDSAQNSSPLMCPINVFEARRFKKTTHSTVPQNALERSLTIASGVSRHYEEPGGLHGKPVLFPCDLRHRRIAPFKDYFSHSYLYVGTPVGLRACYSPLLAVDLPRETNGRWLFKKAWFSLRAKDHAIRGGAHLSLTQKLTEYLISEVSRNTMALDSLNVSTYGKSLSIADYNTRAQIRMNGRMLICLPCLLPTGKWTTRWASGICTPQIES